MITFCKYTLKMKQVLRLREQRLKADEYINEAQR